MMRSCVLFLLFFIMTSSAIGQDAVSVKADTPSSVSSLPAGTARITIHIQPDTKNRMLYIDCYDEGGPVSSSQLQLEGEDGPTFFIRSLTNLDEGTYEVIVTLARTDRSFTARDRFFMN